MKISLVSSLHKHNPISFACAQAYPIRFPFTYLCKSLFDDPHTEAKLTKTPLSRWNIPRVHLSNSSQVQYCWCNSSEWKTPSANKKSLYLSPVKYIFLKILRLSIIYIYIYIYIYICVCVCVCVFFLNPSNHYTPNVIHATSGPRPPHYRRFTVTLRHTTLCRSPLDEWSARHTDLYLTTHSTHNKHNHPCPGRIRTHNPRKRAASDPRLRPRGQQDRPRNQNTRLLILVSVSWLQLTIHQISVNYRKECKIQRTQ